LEFYNLKTRKRIEVPDSQVKKVALTQKTGRRSYALTAEVDGTRLFRFIGKAQYDASPAPEAAPSEKG
jgi:hypothetical protein